MSKQSPWFGLPINVKDKNGNEIHIGDTLRFDEEEWGAMCVFVIDFRKGKVQHPGSISDLTEYCHVTKRWDEEEPGDVRVFPYEFLISNEPEMYLDRFAKARGESASSGAGQAMMLMSM